MSLKDIPQGFVIDSEEDLRFMTAMFFLELGFDQNEFSFEDSFSIRLGHNTIIVGKDKKQKSVWGRSDILVSRNGSPLILVEAKKPGHKLTAEDAQQAISYARLTNQITPFALLTNGREFKVYDVLESNMQEIANPEDSSWAKNGQKLQGLFQDLKTEAEQNLIEINAEILERFCFNQVQDKFKSLKSDVGGNKKFIPELYIERNHLEKSFISWLNSQNPFFAVTSPSGFGKTNFMCSTAEKLQGDHFVLFYSANTIRGSIYSAIINDFKWEFQRSKNIAQIIQKFNDISQKHSKQLIIFIDGLDECPIEVKILRSELLEISTNIALYPNIRFVFSCKSFDWPNFVIDNNQTYTYFAEVIEPDLQNQNLINCVPDPHKVGYRLSEFTAEELEIAIDRYKRVYQLTGEFRGDIKNESTNPLLLRFISEVYSMSGETIPEEITSRELYEKYLKRKLAEVTSVNLTQILLTKTAELIFSNDNRIIDQSLLFSEVDWNDGYDNALQELIRLGILSRFKKDHTSSFLGYEFHKFLLFYYIFKVKRFQQLDLPKKSKCILDLLQKTLGREAVEFFLLVGELQEVNSTLLTICDHDFTVFVSILSQFSGINKYHKEPISSEAILAFLDTYNHLRETIFSGVRFLLQPYTSEKLGVILLSQSDVFATLFRGTTEAYPQEMIIVKDQRKITQLIQGPISLHIKEELNPLSTCYLGGYTEFKGFPALAAYNFLIKQINKLVSNKRLIEKDNQFILQERIYDLLLHHPSSWVENDILPSGKRYYELLNIGKPEEIKGTKIKDVVILVETLLETVQFHNVKPGVREKHKELLSLLFYLKSLPSDRTLEDRKSNPKENFKYLAENNIDEAKTIMQSLYKDIIENFKTLFENNFYNLCLYSPLYISLNHLTFIQITWPTHTDYLALSYGFSKEKPPIKEPYIFTACDELSKTTTLYRPSFSSFSTSWSNSDAGYLVLDEKDFEFLEGQTQFWVSKTVFPSRQPIQNQVYKLISNELKYLLKPSFLWGSDRISDSII
jgi:hypothetical protein